ncbi:YopX family protein [Latilactobacillus sakei]|uniref:YopX family protein n=1 Tax=Latilactobacillus sakei TaxID=1599 RepID=UPI0020213A36|nr:YopX family protein [Latilactobacillus sakei]
MIKFRAWDKENKAFMPSEGYAICDGDVMGLRYGNEMEDVLTDQIELMQYTGLKDVHGVDIYEGNIVKWGDQPNGHESPIRIGVIELNPDIQFITNVGIFEYGRFAYKETNKYLTVIGNKFENPELLEVTE